MLLHKAETPGEQGGIVIHDQELAEKLMMYIDRNLSSQCPTHLKGAKNVAKWFEEQFGVNVSGV